MRCWKFEYQCVRKMRNRNLEIFGEHLMCIHSRFDKDEPIQLQYNIIPNNFIVQFVRRKATKNLLDNVNNYLILPESGHIH